MMGQVVAERPEMALNLKAGEWVEVRSAEQILATLDETQALDGLPFMPEMLQYCGKRFRVYKAAHKTCDTIERFTIRRMNDAVHLEGLRCDGQAHDGCQASCLLFWKEAWLKRVSPTDPAPAPHPPTVDTIALQRATRSAASTAEEPRYRCQATDLLVATTEVRRRDRWNPAFYFKDLTSGNVTVRNFVRFGIIAAVNAFLRRWRGWRYPHLCGLAAGTTPSPAPLHLQPGDCVRVRSKDEIMQTLNSNLRNRGLYFDVEMVPYCDDGQYKVLRRVERLVDEKTGRMLKLSNPCLILDGVTCSGHWSVDRMFCPRAIYPYWREAWLKKAN